MRDSPGADLETEEVIGATEEDQETEELMDSKTEIGASPETELAADTDLEKDLTVGTEEEEPLYPFRREETGETQLLAQVCPQL